MIWTLAAVGLVGCGDEFRNRAIITVPPVDEGVVLRVSPSVDTIRVGQVKTIVLSASTREGFPVEASGASWVSTVPSVVRSVGGSVTGISPGVSNVVASLGSDRATATVHVIP
jgi:hypothetical protein